MTCSIGLLGEAGSSDVSATSHLGAVELRIEGATVSTSFYLVHSSFYSKTGASNAKGWWCKNVVRIHLYGFGPVFMYHSRGPSMTLYIMFRYVFSSFNKSNLNLTVLSFRMKIFLDGL
jgi:hypothetical protein